MIRRVGEVIRAIVGHYEDGSIGGGQPASQERARRRAAELGANPGTVLAEQTLRDERDTTRAHSPLEPAPGAVVLDTTELALGEVVQRVTKLAYPQRP